MNQTSAASDTAFPPSAAATAPAIPAAEITAGYRRYVLWILMFSCALNFLDRQVINILAEPIKDEFGLSDTQLGLLTGLAFATFYSGLSLPVARLADRSDRSQLIATFVGIWSLATAASGLVTNFTQLLLSRIVVGLGEAGGSPPAHSLISDYTPPEKRSSAIAFYTIGIPLGGLLGMVLGGVILDHYGWRTAFLVAGLPGVALALLIWLTLRDPKRDRRRPPASTADAPVPWREAMRELASKRAFILVSLGGAATTFVNYSQGAFIASFFFRAHGEALAGLAAGSGATIGIALGAAGLLGVALGISKGLTGIVGTLLGGRLGDRPGAASYLAHVTVPAIFTALRVPLIIGAVLVQDVVLSFALLAAHGFAMGIAGVGGYAAVQGLVRPRVRATAAAVYMFGLNMIGLGFGPLLVGMLSDTLAAGGMSEADGLRWALVWSSLLLFAAAGFKWWARRYIVQESVG